MLSAISSVFAGNRGAIHSVSFDFYGDTFSVNNVNIKLVDFESNLSEESISEFYDKMKIGGYEPLILALSNYRHEHKQDDWLFYQLVRNTAQILSPKASNYARYTLYKWFLLSGAGYDATISISDDKILFYAQCNEDIYDIPYHTRNGKKYVCLNYHDYGSIDFKRTKFREMDIEVPGAVKAFSYKLTSLPRFTSDDYSEKELAFNYQNVNYHFTVKLNAKIKSLFANYPVADYKLYFEMPLSNETYKSLIPQLKDNVRSMGTRRGIDYLMRFTRYAFLYQPDGKNFGKEKRLLPEQTLLYEGSDCEDRAALFFCLVKEIYNLPMIVLAYPEHVTVAVKFDKPVGTPILYKGQQYSICEPTPQKRDMPIGATPSGLAYEVAYAYNPE